MDEIEIPDDLSSLSVSELQALLDKVNEAGKVTADAAKEADGDERKELVATLESLREAKKNVSTALEAAEAAEVAEQTAIAEAAAEFGDGDEDEDGDEDDAATGDEDDDAAADDEATAVVEEPVAVAASGKFKVPARRRRVPEGRNMEELRESPFFVGSDRVESLMQLADLFKRASKASVMNGDGMARVARMARFANADAAKRLHGNDAHRNTAIMAAATVTQNTDVIMASGGFCGPAEALTVIEQCGRTDTPVGDGIAMVNSPRGKYRYVKQTGLEAVDAGIDYWTEANDEEVDPDDTATHKPCYHLDCGTEIEAVPVGIPVCFQYGTFQEWSFPEQVAATLAKFDVALARRSEALVLQRIHEQSNQYTYTPPVGESVSNGLIRLVGQLLQLAGYNGRNSLDGYTLAVPEALILDLIVDSAIKAWVGPTLSRADIVAQLEDRFGIAVLLSPDVRVNAPAPVEALADAPAPAGGALPCPHTIKEVLLYKPADFRHSVDDVDIVVQTDIATAKKNDKSVFLETIETTEKLGCSPSFSVLYDGTVVTGSQPDLVANDDTYCPGPTPNPYGVDPVGFPGGPVA